MKPDKLEPQEGDWWLRKAPSLHLFPFSPRLYSHTPCSPSPLSHWHSGSLQLAHTGCWVWLIIWVYTMQLCLCNSFLYFYMMRCLLQDAQEPTTFLIWKENIYQHINVWIVIEENLCSLVPEKYLWWLLCLQPLSLIHHLHLLPVWPQLSYLNSPCKINLNTVLLCRSLRALCVIFK